MTPVPCRFCGSPECRADAPGISLWRVACDNCGAHGPLARSEEEAVARWNQPAAEAAVEVTP
jgi:hypothetical protein